MKIRTPRAQDFARIAELAGELGYASSAADIAARLAGMNESEDHAVFVAETASGEIAGWVGVFVSRAVETDARVEISGLVVGAEVRSQGMGALLLERAEEWALERGCRSIGLRSNVLRERAHAFYLRNGYEHVKTQKSLRKKL
ncbi:MAG: GNAT family N-acetyltransferase [Candidatus Acidiferrales bacterium]